MVKQDTIDAYIGTFPDDVRRVLQMMRRTIRKAAPAAATETISYNMPTFELDGHSLVYFAGWTKHLSLYPISPEIERSMKEIAAYKTSGRGTIQFPLNKPLPLALITKIVKHRVKEMRGRVATK